MTAVFDELPYFALENTDRKLIIKSALLFNWQVTMDSRKRNLIKLTHSNKRCNASDKVWYHAQPWLVFFVRSFFFLSAEFDISRSKFQKFKTYQTNGKWLVLYAPFFPCFCSFLFFKCSESLIPTFKMIVRSQYGLVP